MRLYLVQHGEATPETVDPARPLTEKGRADVSRVAAFLKKVEVKVDPIWHSTKARAIQTAQILAEAIQAQGSLELKEGLAPNDPVDGVAQEVRNREKDLMIVGHLPFLQKLASLLITGSPSSEPIGFRQGGVVCLERNPQGAWQFLWAITPDLLRSF